MFQRFISRHKNQLKDFNFKSKLNILSERKRSSFCTERRKNCLQGTLTSRIYVYSACIYFIYNIYIHFHLFSSQSFVNFRFLSALLPLLPTQPTSFQMRNYKTCVFYIVSCLALHERNFVATTRTCMPECACVCVCKLEHCYFALTWANSSSLFQHLQRELFCSQRLRHSPRRHSPRPLIRL